MRRVAGSILVLILLTSVELAGAQKPLGREFQVNTHTTDTQNRPSVAVDGAGNFVVVWNSLGQDGPSFGVFGQRFSPTALPAGLDFPVNSYTTSGQFVPSVAVDGAGNFVVVWRSFFQDGSSEGVFGQRFDSVGSVGSEFPVNTSTLSFQSSPSVAADGAGKFVVAWEGQESSVSVSGVFGQRFDSVGSVGSEFQVNTYINSDQSSQSVAMDVAGKFVVVWQSYDQDGSYYGVFGQRFSSSVVKVGSEFAVNSYTTSSQSYPSVAMDGAGKFVVVWRTQFQDGSGDAVFGQRFRFGGLTIFVAEPEAPPPAPLRR